MQKLLVGSFPMQMEIINIDSSESESDTEFESTQLYGLSTNSIANPSGNALGMFRDQNHDTTIHTNGGKMSASHLSSGSIPVAVTSDVQATIAENDGADVASMSNGLEKSFGSHEKDAHSPQPQKYSGMIPQMNPENGTVISNLGIDAQSSQSSKRTLPSSFLSVPSVKSHGEKNKWYGASVDGLADTASRLDAKSKQHTQKEGHLSYVQARNTVGFVDDQRSNRISMLQDFGAANASGPIVHLEGVGKTKNENNIHEKDHRTLPPWWNKHGNASMASEGNSKNNGTKLSHTMSVNKSDNAQRLPDSLIRNEKRTTSLEGLYEGRDDVYIYENASTSRVLPPSFLHGKFTSNARLGGSSDRGNFPGNVERRPEHDETPIYQEALQNLGQPNLEDDLPEGLMSVTLLKHQKISLAWMVQKEKSVHCAGGILADDQGLGKTISMIALILKQMDLQLKFTSGDSHHVTPEALNLDDDEACNDSNAKCIEKMDRKTKQMASNSDNCKPAAGTLVVCPASVLRQWARELDEKVCDSAKLSYLVYHGGTRTKDPRFVAKHDVVLTTYSIITNEVPKQPLVDDDNDDQRNMDKYGVAPEFRAGKKRKQTPSANRNGKKNGKGLKESQFDYDSGPIARVRWFRVVLDEAQTIKNHRTKVARACCGLRAKRRWCLSGTPMQNAIDDLYSYFKFLKYEPYSAYSSFCNTIKYPISRNASHGYKKLQTLLRIVLLRRTKGTFM
ncbi:Putative SWI/SNF-related matrix-associated actin-dependent regulator of chromatin subfamily A member 3-like 2 [Apostasia shenzhenica]|uniref:SWI/SNF-related matrix-associated actin-dependent regulator of chromatin subfamily A member 3-like 2 n=1 Tax=Apostasia shenzhenica TaxID=1088818 RepID=A0A2H9ZRF1_9ASPA|nr:Putative SWI/SNF-related matrix-associated actin-dependent regulator of chromatin subfamily A member 3-like 2 [Apostasia shenzhenica]